MEPLKNTMRIFLGRYPVVDIKFAGGVTINLGKNVHVTMWFGDLEHSLKPGDEIPLYTEIPCLNWPITNQTNTPNAS